MSKGFFVGLQEDFELMTAERKIKEELNKIVPIDYKKHNKIAL